MGISADLDFQKMYTTLTSPVVVRIATRGRYGGVVYALHH